MDRISFLTFRANFPNADYIANNQLDLAYDQGAMPAFRRRMAARIIAGTLDAEEARQPGAPLRSECL